MIGLVLRSVVGDSFGILGPVVAILAICGLMQLCKCRLRDCSCCKRCLRATGTDPFDDFEMMVLVHKATYTSSSRIPVVVRVRAGDYEVCTDPSGGGIFQQAMSIFVEQGTEFVSFQLMDTSENVLAELHMPVMKEILCDHDGHKMVSEKTFVMKQKVKTFLNPRLVLTFSPESPGDEEQALLHGLNASSETEWMLHQQLQKTQDLQMVKGGVQEPLSELQLLARGCMGPLHMFGSLGAKDSVYVGVLGPPRRKKFALHIWKDETDYSEDRMSKQEIELLRISAIAPDPSRPEVFTVAFLDKDKSQQKAVFQRIDRSRDVWVELLQILVTKVHEDHQAKKNAKRK